MATSDKQNRQVTIEKIENGDPYIIPQPERLYTVRPRYFKDPSTRGSTATFRLITRGVSAGPNVSASAGLAERVRKKLVSENGYADFLLQGLQIGFNEKSQVIQTFGDAETVYYFGRTPTTVSISGALLDDIDNDWFTRFVVGYNDFLRGTQLARNFELVQISTNNATFTGTLMNLNFNHNSQNDAYVPFTCTLLIREFEYHSSYQFGTELADDVEYLGAEECFIGITDTPTKSQADINETLAKSFQRDDVITAGAAATQETFTSSVLEKPIPADSSAVFPSGIYAKEATPSFNETLGGIADTIQKLSESINKFADAVQEFTEDLLSPINEIIGTIQDISNAAFSVVAAIDNTIDSVLDPIAATVQNIEQTRRQLKNLRGTLTSLPESLSEKVSRFARSGYISNSGFLQSPSANISAADALSTMRSSNIRTPRSTGQVGPASQATNTADQVARL